MHVRIQLQCGSVWDPVASCNLCASSIGFPNGSMHGRAVRQGGHLHQTKKLQLQPVDLQSVGEN